MAQKYDSWERQHRQQMAALEKRLQEIYEEVAREASALGVSVEQLTDDLFSFDDYPATKDRIDRLMKEFHDRVEEAIVDGVDSQWTLANNKNNELARMVFGNNLTALSIEQQRQYFTNNDKARQAFLERKAQGLDLSDRVWKYSDMYKREIEMSLDVGIRDGDSAAKIARDMKQYLEYPDKLFRRVRDQHGNLVLSQAARDFHPGQGVYRSSYMNARRTAVTETNMAYRSADHMRQMSLDFVVGIEIHLSGNHTCKGHKGVFHDICDDLQGKYPKAFKFTGWHPHCRCYTTTILKTPAEMAADEERMRQGKEPLPPESSVNYVKDVPPGFKSWMNDHQEQISTAKNLPYFLKDNGSRAEDGTYTLNKFTAQTTPAPAPTPEPKQPEPKPAPNFSDMKDYDEMEPYLEELLPIAKRFGLDARDIKYAIQEGSPVIARSVLSYKYESYRQAVEAWAENERQMAEKLGVKPGKPMTFKQANEGKGNPHYEKGSGSGYTINCQASVVAHELRMRGWNVEACMNTNAKDNLAYQLSQDTRKGWINPISGQSPKSRIVKHVRNGGTVVEQIDQIIEPNKRYHMMWNWKAKDAHIVTIQRTKGDIFVYDPQTGKRYSYAEWAAEVLPRIDTMETGIHIYRVDNLMPNPEFAGVVAKAGTTKPSTIRYADKPAGWGGVKGGPHVSKEFKLERKELLNTKTVKTQPLAQPSEGVVTKKLLRSSSVLDRFRSHCYNKEEVEAAKYIWENPDKMRFIRKSPLGEGKNMEDPYDMKNIQKKKDRGVKEYMIYEFDYKGKTYTLKTELHEKGFEQFYSMVK